MDENKLLDDLFNEDQTKGLGEGREVLKPKILDQKEKSEDNGNSDDRYNRTASGKFGKGNKGRPPGVKAKTTNEMKAWLMQFVTDKTEDMYDVWDDLSPRDKAAFFMHVIKFIMPNDPDAGEQQNITITMVPAPKRKDK